MSRITDRTATGRVMFRHGEESGVWPYAEYPNHEYAAAIERLAAYEDLGSVEECAAVVRCRDCENYTPYFSDSECRTKSEGKCGLTMGTRPEHHFCAWGQRRK